MDTEKKRFECKYCIRTYATASGRARHVHATHDGIKHTCPWCNRKYTRKERLRIHLYMNKSCSTQQKRLTDEIKRLNEELNSPSPHTDDNTCSQDATFQSFQYNVIPAYATVSFAPGRTKLSFISKIRHIKRLIHELMIISMGRKHFLFCIFYFEFFFLLLFSTCFFQEEKCFSLCSFTDLDGFLLGLEENTHI